MKRNIRMGLLIAVIVTGFLSGCTEIDVPGNEDTSYDPIFGYPSTEQLQEKFRTALESNDRDALFQLAKTYPEIAAQFEITLNWQIEGPDRNDFIEKMQILPLEQQLLWSLYLEAGRKDQSEKMGKLIRDNLELADRLQWAFERFGTQNTISAVQFRLLADALKKAIACEQGKCEEEQQLPVAEDQEFDDLYDNGVKAMQSGDYDLALTYLQASLESAKKLNTQENIQTALAGIGLLYFEKNDYDEALSYLRASLEAVTVQNGTTFLSLYLIGKIHVAINKREDAVRYLEQALDVSTTTNICTEIEFNTFCKAKIDAFRILAGMYDNQGHYQRAIDYFHHILSIYNYRGDSEGQIRTLARIGWLYLKLGNSREFSEYMERSLKINDNAFMMSIEELGLNEESLTLLRNDAQGEHEKSLQYYHQKLEEERTSGTQYSVALNLAGIGQTYLKMGQYEKALSSLHDAEAIFIQEQALNDLWKIYRDIGFAYTYLKLTDKAIATFERSLDIIEMLGERFDDIEQRFLFKQTQSAVYDTLIELLSTAYTTKEMKQYAAKAFEIFERRQGRWFLDMIGESVGRKILGVSDTIIQREQYLNELQESMTPHGKEGTSPELLQETFEQIQAARDTMKKETQASFPDYYELRYPQPIALENLQQDVLEPNELMLVYHVMETQTVLWAISQQAFMMMPLNLTEEQVTQAVEAFRKAPNDLIAAAQQSPVQVLRLANHTLADMTHQGYALYQLLVPETVRPLLAQVQTVFIVPTGPLYGVPFEALVTNDPAVSPSPHYLVQDHPITYLSSASLLKILRDAQARRKQTTTYPLLAFANPVYDVLTPTPSVAPGSVPAEPIISLQGLQHQAYLTLMGGNAFPPLPDTETQAQAIAETLNAPPESEPLQLGEQAAKQTVLQFNQARRLDDYRYVLFAAHGILPGEINQITQPAIVLSHPEQDGYLTMADAFSLQLNAKLVLLSACNTGRGVEVKGEGIMGLTRAFMYAGTPAVGVTLWSVDSKASADITTRMFQHLKDGKTLAVALQQAKLDLLNEAADDETLAHFRHPFFWAPFVVFGMGGNL